MNNEIVGYYNGNFRIDEHILNSFNIIPNSFEDMIQMNETNKIKVQLFDIQSDTIHNDDSVELEMINFIKNEAFLIVFGGWIPCTFIKQNSILLADRNIVSEIIRRYKNGIKKVNEEPDSFDSIFLNNNRIMLDISAFVIEGNERKISTNDMIDEQIAIVKKDIKSALPKLEIATYPNGNTYYYELNNLSKQSIENRMIFLQNIAPKLNKQFTEKSREKAIDIVFNTAEEMKLARNDIVIILALLRILMKGKKTAAQLLLKDSQTFSEENAYNAAFDLTTIEMLYGLDEYHRKSTNYNIALITQDKGLALFASLFNNTKISGRAEGKVQVKATIPYSVFSDDEDLLKNYKKWLNWEV
ncbi:MAG: hypothetical protein A2329_05670 [Sulfurimonas sp. RIFOXYB2_FULL_37_5]|uniref:hypothetical protein n=1 Tax=Sulfurimonas sp. RIFOXYB12_FULL_35_9 TaxID=1802256 RepID=UPI0008BD7E08|nr:hypothetical protein [Sulfurimonas sp. RIFOXYB12_FULL_35_9]OHE03674.1 MAG: hypothetical protein A2345_04815 [Sulfurimonas sp. RIFOXYB12_FULL_35_9]OHE16025.1 MAG: hypothetical protein A2329_05670 [Sulfurimonas sp. RIFOXYB2_FULL_37_5]